MPKMTSIATNARIDIAPILPASAVPRPPTRLAISCAAISGMTVMRIALIHTVPIGDNARDTCSVVAALAL